MIYPIADLKIPYNTVEELPSILKKELMQVEAALKETQKEHKKIQLRRRALTKVLGPAPTQKKTAPAGLVAA